MKKYELENVTKPNLYEHLFDYSKVPVIEFEEATVPLDRPKEIWITDTTFRDGQQARPPYDVEQIVKLYKFMHKLGGPKGVIRQSEFFLYTEKDKKAVEKCLELGYKFPEVTGWIRAVKEDFKLVKAMGLKETGILTSLSDYHIFLKLKKTREQAMNDFLSVIDAALEAGVRPRCHYEDITRADFYGFVISFTQKLMERSKQAGIPIKIRACDTMGFGLPFPNATLPRSVPKIFHALHKEAGVPHEMLEWHGHNDFHKVLANSTTAWLYGCASINSSLLGFGERTGNAPLEGLIMDWIALHNGDPQGIDTTVITDIARFFHDELNEHIAVNYPFIGKDFNTTRAGIHADGINKDERIYNIFDTGKLLNRPLMVAITDKSGVAGISMWLNNHFRLSEEQKLDKSHPGVKRIAEWVAQEYQNHRISSISSAELIEQAKKHLPHLFHSDLEGLKKRGSQLAIELIEKMIAQHPELDSMDRNQIEPILSKYLIEGQFVKLIYVVEKNGLKITNNIAQAEDMDKYNKFLGLGTDMSDRAWFKKAIANKNKATVSEFYISRAVNELCITVSKTIIKNNEIVGVLSIDIDFDNLVKLLPNVE